MKIQWVWKVDCDSKHKIVTRDDVCLFFQNAQMCNCKSAFIHQRWCKFLVSLKERYKEPTYLAPKIELNFLFQHKKSMAILAFKVIWRFFYRNSLILTISLFTYLELSSVFNKFIFKSKLLLYTSIENTKII